MTSVWVVFVFKTSISTIYHDKLLQNNRKSLKQLLFLLSPCSEEQLSIFNKGEDEALLSFKEESDPERLHNVKQEIGDLIELGLPFSRSDIYRNCIWKIFINHWTIIMNLRFYLVMIVQEVWLTAILLEDDHFLSSIEHHTSNHFGLFCRHNKLNHPRYILVFH